MPKEGHPDTALAILIIAVITLLALIALFYFVRKRRDKTLARAFPQRADGPIVRQGGCVIAYHEEAREIGEAVLRAGGNAFDAFVATAAAENVMSEGMSSFAGPLGVMVYRAENDQVVYMDADFNDPVDPSAYGTLTDKELGKAVLVPGAPAGLEALATRYGRLSFSELLEPAIALAEDGYPVNRMLAVAIASYGQVVKKTDYGRNTFFPHGQPLKIGEVVKQPEVAEFLRRLGQEGSAYIYRGDWGDRFLSEVETHGGGLTAKDLAGYDVKWCDPWTTSYRGYTIHSSSCRSYGGLWVLLALKTLEQTTLPATPRYWEDADTLEQMIRISHQVWSEPDIFNYRLLDNPEFVRSLLTAEHASSIWARVRDKTPLNFLGLSGSHSYHIIVHDDEGNIASGTTTIYANPWADGLFVEGVPLASAGRVPWNTKPGQRRLSGLSIHLACKDGQPRFAVGSISNSLAEASFQFLVKLIDYQMSVRDTVSTPRFGSFDAKGDPTKPRINFGRNWLDPRVDSRIVKTLKARGLGIKQDGAVDTGLGAVMRIESGGKVEGITAPVPYLSNPYGVLTL